jgi:hypothetical protein
MSGVGYMIAAYLGAAALYGAYFVSLRRRERAIKPKAPHE